MKILAVDDDRLFLDFLREELSQIGFCDVTLAESVESAWLAVHSTPVPFDCYLLDIDMPEKSGIELCTDLRQHDVAASCPIIMITSMSQPSVMDRAFSAGASDFLAKPICTRELNGRLKMASGQVREKRLRLQIEQTFSILQPPDFHEPLSLEFDSSQSYSKFLKRVFELNSKSQYDSSLFCVHFENAKEVYEKLSFAEFEEFLCDIGEMISSSCGRSRKQICYAGSGDFLILSKGQKFQDKMRILNHLAFALEGRRISYGTLGWPSPFLKVGIASKKGLFSSPNPKILIASAISDAKLGGVAVSLKDKHLTGAQ